MRLRQAIKILKSPAMINGFANYSRWRRFSKAYTVRYRRYFSRQSARYQRWIWNNYMDASQSIAGDDYQ